MRQRESESEGVGDLAEIVRSERNSTIQGVRRIHENSANTFEYFLHFLPLD